MFENSTLALLLIVLCCGGCGGDSMCGGNNQCLALLLIVLCCGCGNTGTFTSVSD